MSALLAVVIAYFLAFLIYGIAGGDLESIDRVGFLAMVGVLWIAVGAAFNRIWIAALPLIPYLTIAVLIQLTEGGVHYGRDAVTMEQLLAVAVFALALGYLLRNAVAKLLLMAPK